MGEIREQKKVLNGIKIIYCITGFNAARAFGHFKKILPEKTSTIKAKNGSVLTISLLSILKHAIQQVGI
jgi:hypothetical protein